jgi:anti-anti-sigma factor
MTAAHNKTIDARPHADAVGLECGSAVLTAHTYGWLTVITIVGDIDATNADLVGHQAVALVPHDRALIVDMAHVGFIGVDGLRALFAINAECIRTDIKLALIASRAVERLLRVGDRERLIPAVGSATEALHVLRRRNRRGGPLTLVTSAS